MKYKVGDRVRIIGGAYDVDGLRKGDVFTILKHNGPRGDYTLYYGSNGSNSDMPFFESEIEPAADLTLSVDIPTQAMKEFADQCERAAAALERIKEALK